MRPLAVSLPECKYKEFFICCREEVTMRFDELRFTADGGVIVEGRIAIVPDGAGSGAPEVDGDIVVNLNPAEYRRSIRLLPRLERQPDGFYDWRPPIVSLGLNLDLPLPKVFYGGVEPFRFEAATTLGEAVSVWAAAQIFGREGTMIFGDMPALTIEGRRMPDALHLSLTGAIAPMEPREGVEARPGAQLRCDLAIPWIALEVQQSPLAMLRPSRSMKACGPWQPGAPGLAALATSGGRLLFLDGHLALQHPRRDLYPEGPLVGALIGPNSLTLKAGRAISRRADGTAWWTESHDGPELSLPIGHAHLARMLTGAERASTNFSGSGIGSVDGQTGRVMESGGPCTQLINELQLTIERSEAGVQLWFEGELDPLPSDHWAVSLGPRFEAACFVPQSALIMQQWKIPDLAQRRRDRFGINFG